MILVLHDILSALKISDKIVVMDEGKIIRCGIPEEILRCGVIEKIYGVSVKSVNAGGKTEFYCTEALEV
ncbi:MAG: hypothetical protein K2J73_05745 [Oscillospiraceae bacterium]|nr:hypothetical protein [Oscillospiraceae bacterium]